MTLDEFLSRHALGNHQSGTAKTYVATTDSHIVVGYYSLAASQILYADAPTRLQKGAPRHPIPVVLLARLAVDRSWQGKGLGAELVKEAENHCVNLNADLIWFNAREKAVRFYEKNDYQILGDAFEIPDVGTHFVMFKKL